MKEFQEQLLKRLDRVADTFDRLATVLTLESGAVPQPVNALYLPPRRTMLLRLLLLLCLNATVRFHLRRIGRRVPAAPVPRRRVRDLSRGRPVVARLPDHHHADEVRPDAAAHGAGTG